MLREDINLIKKYIKLNKFLILMSCLLCKNILFLTCNFKKLNYRIMYIFIDKYKSYSKLNYIYFY